MANGFLGQQSNNYYRIMGTRDAEARFSRKKDHPEQAKCHIVKVGSPFGTTIMMYSTLHKR